MSDPKITSCALDYCNSKYRNSTQNEDVSTAVDYDNGMIIPDLEEELKVPVVQTPEIIAVDYKFYSEVEPEIKKTVKKEEISPLDIVDVMVVEPEMEKITSEAQVPVHIKMEDGESGSLSLAFSAFILSASHLLLL